MLRLARGFSCGCRKIMFGLVAGIIATSLGSQVAEAQQQYAHNKRQETAVAHYSRARAMLVAALEEFEQGRRYARPDLLVDSEDWRLKVVSLTEELNRVIDPQIKVTREGVRTKANPRLVRREFQALPKVADGARDGNFYGEQQRADEIEAARARLYDSPQDAPAAAAEPQQQTKAVDEDPSDELEIERSQATEAKAVVDKSRASKYDTEEEELEDESSSTPQEIPAEIAEDLELSPPDEEGEQTNQANEGAEAEELSEEARAASNDQEIATQIDEAIQERLKSLEVGEDDGIENQADSDEDRIE